MTTKKDMKTLQNLINILNTKKDIGYYESMNLGNKANQLAQDLHKSITLKNNQWVIK